MALRWHELPIETVRLVIAHAARSALGDNVSWLAQLSLVSRAIFDIVTPILYATLVVTGTNGTRVRAVTKEARLMAYLRKVYIGAQRNGSSWQWYEDAAHIIGLPESLRRLPRLTHLAIDMSRESLDPPTDTAFSERVRNMLSVILETTDGRLEVLALRVAGTMLARWDSVVRVVAGMRDRRLRLWHDDRIGNTTFLRVQDARIGRDVWTEAKQL